jgi:hypothetical protein
MAYRNKDNAPADNVSMGTAFALITRTEFSSTACELAI